MCSYMFAILIACTTLCRWLCFSLYGYCSSTWAKAGLVQAICMCDTTYNNRHIVGVILFPLVVLTNHSFLRHYFKLKVPINDCCFRGFSVVVIFVCVCWLYCRQLDSRRLFWPHSKITASYCCHTAALSSIFRAVTTVLCLLPTAVVPLSINSSP